MEHIPVLLHESIDGLNIMPDGLYVDGTLGRGGHALEIVKKLDNGRLLAIDCDKDAINEAGELLSGYNDKITLIQDNFKNIANILSSENIGAVDGMIFDFGVSSPQLDNAKRGFSYMQDAPLDMRMDTKGSLTAQEIINNRNEDELRRIFFEYGEERYSKSIAREIVKKREFAPIDTTFKLNNIIISAIPSAARREAQHPSKRCFQALRIAVNDELGSISSMLDIAPSLLKPGGRLCVISFHSLEDRLVKRSFAAAAKGCICPKDFPVCVCKQKPVLKLITRKPLSASNDEIERNPRARSAKLRIAEKII
ncbi:MAG: 16S rRNA (cytosine(1402)-N(4))-methyltransferase RsmH [Oscillospiraceae bacterium]|jgi:16S rRNA (cytosine1402-N4)-methyltransferase|nr:16S rRNA (cytosine(1402)-N(4))-methyltransferase RsmH [Oscillospiraceae bacterium]